MVVNDPLIFPMRSVRPKSTQHVFSERPKVVDLFFLPSGKKGKKKKKSAKNSGFFPRERSVTSVFC